MQVLLLKYGRCITRFRKKSCGGGIGGVRFRVKYSVIIPVYNAEKTLRRCLDSLLSQPYPDCELILVNDGSSDESGIICKEYAAKHRQVCVVDKENGGVSSARNAGLDRASGKYVVFVDSDDYVADNFFSLLDQTLKLTD